MSLRMILCLQLLGLAVAEGQVTGTVTDSKSSKALRGVEIFINNTSITTTTDSDGAFALTGIRPGFAELVLYKDGYELFKSPIRTQEGKAYQLNLTLAKAEKSRSSKPKPIEDYKKIVEWFQQALLGDGEFVSLCRVENLKDIVFERINDRLMVTSQEPVVVLNKALGYRIKFYIQSFEAGVQSVAMQGLSQFDTLKAKDYIEQTYWNRNREKAFWGSDRHLFKSMLTDELRDNGFELLDENNRPLDTDALVKPAKLDGYFEIQLPERTVVKYSGELGETGIQVDDARGQISTIITTGKIEVTSEGVLFNSNAVNISGNLSSKGFAIAVPANFTPSTSMASEQVDWQNFGLLQEKVYIHTDRDYYYPRETIWFKAYLGFSMPILRDTLSRLLYVEFIAPSGQVIQTRNVKIRNGIGWGEFVLPIKLNKGEYYIRAYTNWMRNYDDGTYIRQVPILAYDENLQLPDDENSTTGNVHFTFDKPQYHTRDKIQLSLNVTDDSGKPLKANASLSVTDISATAPIPAIPDITAPGLLEVKTIDKKSYFDAVEYYMERGISFAGKVVDEKGKGLAVNLDIIQGNMDNLVTMETTADGEFLVTGLDFTDSLNFAFKPTNDRGKLTGQVKLLDRDVPVFTYQGQKLKLDYESANALQRVQNTYDLDKNTILLNEVVVEEKAIKAEDKTLTRIYGEPDHVVQGADLRGTIAGMNPLIALQGKVPGLRVQEYFDQTGIRHVKVTTRGGSSSITGNTDPIVLVDGILWGSPDDLINLSPSIIDRIEVKTGAVTAYGSRGTNGLIAIYTKSGIEDNDAPKDYLTYKLGGYSKPLVFKYPDHSKNEMGSSTDLRTTIYWNPSLSIGNDQQAQVEFFAADLETKYRVEVEGMTEDGKPFHGVTFITISNR